MERRIGIVLPGVGSGGAEKATLRLGRFLIERGYRVDLLVIKFKGGYRREISDAIGLYALRRRRIDRDLVEHCRLRGVRLRFLRIGLLNTIFTWCLLRWTWPGLRFRPRHASAALCVAKFLDEAKPHLLFSAMPAANNAAILGLERVRKNTPLVVSIRNNAQLSYTEKQKKVARALMPKADAVVAVSQGVAADAIRTFGVDEERVYPIYNLTPVAELRRLAEENPNHPWFGKGEPLVILTVLRKAPQKDWATLVRAFGLVHQKYPARLAIMGQLPELYRKRVFDFAEKIGVKEEITFLGFDENPYRYMSRAALFVHSSRWEGLPNVLIDSLACGTPVVSTDTPYGPGEILENGRWGRLTPVGDAKAMAKAILESLAGDTVPAEALRRRAEYFSAERAVAAYEVLFEKLIEADINRNTIGRSG